MHGQNAVAKPRTVDDGYLVKEIFYTLQGEGPWAGRPAIFVRFAGCNLRCHFCDTDFDAGTLYSLAQLCTEIVEKRQLYQCRFVVLTGGEPLLQDVTALIKALPGELSYQIETAGTVWCEGLEEVLCRASIICSPKTPEVHPQVKFWANNWKYVIREGEVSEADGLPVMSTQRPGQPAQLFRPSTATKLNIFVQPCDEGDAQKNSHNTQAAVNVALQFGYRLSVQTHKIVGLP
jgi:organic radical activating enzyme